MTQGAPVLAGMNNSASQMTTIIMDGPNLGLSVAAASPHGSVNPVWAAIAAGGADPGAAGVYAIGRRRGVYAVGLDGEGVWAYSWSSDGVRGTTAVSSSAGVVGQHTADGVGVLGESANGIGVHGQTASPEGQNAGVFGESSGYGMGVRGTSAQGVGVMGECQGGVAGVGILGQNSSNNSDGAGVLAIGGLGVGLQASGARAPISLVPNLAVTGAPTTGSHSMGELMIDKNGDLFLCKADGTPGTWVKVA